MPWGRNKLIHRGLRRVGVFFPFVFNGKAKGWPSFMNYEHNLRYLLWVYRRTIFLTYHWVSRICEIWSSIVDSIKNKCQGVDGLSGSNILAKCSTSKREENISAFLILETNILQRESIIILNHKDITYWNANTDKLQNINVISK